MKSALVLIASCTLALMGIACSDLVPPGVCAGVGYWALQIAITDQRGEARALGSTVTLIDGSYVEADQSYGDTLHILAAQDRGGRTYDIRVSKPYYKDATIKGVKTRGGGCVTGHENPPVTMTIPVVLELLPDAPPIRSLHFSRHHILLDRTYTETFAFKPYVDADPGVSRAVTWSLTGDTASVAFDKVTGTLKYRCLPNSGYLWVFARSVVDPRLLDSADVAVQGHPAATNDPACS